MPVKAWVKGPLELLQHGLEHLDHGSDFDKRMAMIIIDNAVEVMIKTYLALPERATGIKVPRKRQEEANLSFPELLNCLEEFASVKLAGIDLVDIEWNHRIRNQLYHQGNGVTVDSERVEVYAEIATLLLCSLFDVDRNTVQVRPSSAGELLQSWAKLESQLRLVGSPYIKSTTGRPMIVGELATQLGNAGILPEPLLDELRQVSHLRNQLAHGADTFTPEEIGLAVVKIKELTKAISQL